MISATMPLTGGAIAEKVNPHTLSSTTQPLFDIISLHPFPNHLQPSRISHLPDVTISFYRPILPMPPVAAPVT